MSARPTAWLLTASLPVFVLGAGMWRLDFQAPELLDVLRAIHHHHQTWMWIHLWLAIGLVVGLVALSGLVEELRRAGDRFFAPAGLMLYVVGSIPWLMVMVARVTLFADFAARADVPGVVESYAPWHRAAGVVVAAHLGLAYVGTICLGVAVLKTKLLGARVGRSGVVLGAIMTLGLAVVPYAFLAPFMVLVYPFIVGVALVRARKPPVHD